MCVSARPRWLRTPGRRASALAALFPLAVLPGLAIVHGGGRGRSAASWMLAYVLLLAGVTWRECAQRDQALWVAAARALALLAIAARFLDLPLG